MKAVVQAATRGHELREVPTTDPARMLATSGSSPVTVAAPTQYQPQTATRPGIDRVAHIGREDPEEHAPDRDALEVGVSGHG